MNFKTANVKHQLNDVFTDIMHISLDRADDDLSHFLYFFLFNMRFENVQSRVQGVGGHQKFRYKILLLIVEISNGFHTHSQAIHDRLEGIHALIQCDLSPLFGHIFLKFHHRLSQLF